MLPFPLAGQGWGEGVCELQYFFQHRFRLKQHVVVPEPQRLEAKGSHGVAAFVIMRNTCVFSMLAAVKLNDQPYFKTGKIGEVGANGTLAAKFQVAELSGTQS